MEPLLPGTGKGQIMTTTILTSDNLKQTLQGILANRPHTSTLIALDLDNTVFYPIDGLQRATQQWFDGYRHYLMSVKGYSFSIALDHAHEQFYDLHESMSMIETESGIVHYLNQLASSYSLIGLTARSYGILLQTHRELQAVALDKEGSSTAPLSFKFHRFPDLHIEFGPLPADHAIDPRYQRMVSALQTPSHIDRDRLKHYARFYKGILFAGLNPKGDSLIALFKTVSLSHFTTVIFADDKRDHVLHVGHAIAQFNAEHHTTISYCGIHYTAMADTAKNFTFDPLVHLPPHLH